MESCTENSQACTCGSISEEVYEENGDLEPSTTNETEPDKIDLSGLNLSDCDTDSLESISITSSIVTDFQNGTETIKGDRETLASTSGSSISGSPTIDVKNAKSLKKNNGSKRESATGKFLKQKTLDLTQLQSRKNGKENKSMSQADRRKSESCILQTSTESHGIRETRLSRSRFEKRHESHHGPHCEGENYLTPTQRKDNLLRDLKKEVKELKSLLSDKTNELEIEKQHFEKRIEMAIAEKDTEIVILKSDIVGLQEKNEELQKLYSTALNSIDMLEATIKELKESIAEKERNNERVFLETYRKGQMSALFERNEELERMAVSCDGSRITIRELIQKLLLTENELGKWQSIRRQESYESAPKPETEADVTLRFLKDAFYHYTTDSKDNDFHLRAIIRILNFTDVQKTKIAEAIVARRKQKNSTI